MSAPVRFALAGYGFGGRYFHAPFLASSPRCELVGVVTTSDERRAQVAAEHPGVRHFASLDELPGAGVEAVAISTPASTHSELTDAALRLGLHVVCDKPFAMDAAAAAASVALADELGLHLSPFQNRRWDSDFLTVAELLRQGALGELVGFESRFERFTARGPGPAGGGTILDFGSHLVDQALLLFGPVERVYAEWRMRESGLDDDVFASLVHVSGVRAHLWGSWTESTPGLRYRVTGTEATYAVDGPMDGQEAALLRGETPATQGDRWGEEPPDRWGTITRGASGEQVVHPTRNGAWHTFYDGFAAAVRGEGPVPVRAADAVATAQVLDALRASASTGEVVPVAPA